MKDATSIDELIYLISTLHRFQKPASIQPAHYNERIKKRLDVLDGIALLLVTDSPSDTVATTSTQRQSSITIRFATNSAVKISADYINRILNRLNLLTISDDRNEAAGNILLIALIPCFPKIRQRTTKLWNACKEVLPHEVTKDDFNQFVQKLFVGGDGDEKVRSAKLMSNFFEELFSFSRNARPVTEKRDRSIWAAFLRTAYRVAKLDAFSTVGGPYSDIRRRTAKLGEYFQASIRIVTAYLSPELRKYQHAITVEQVPTTAPVLAKVRNPLQIINHYKKPEDPEISIESFKRAFPSAHLHPGPINISASVHCELTVAMHKMKSSSAENPFLPVEIGMSKHSSFMYGRFIEKFNGHYQKQFVVVSDRLQGGRKAHEAGWRFPLETPPDVQRDIMELVKKEVDELRSFADSKRRRSDFSPTENLGDEGDEARTCHRDPG